MIVWLFRGEFVPLNFSLLALRLELYDKVKKFSFCSVMQKTIMIFLFFNDFLIIKKKKGTPGNVLIL